MQWRSSRLASGQSIEESEAIALLEEAHGIIEGYGEPNLVRRYFSLVEDFINKYGLRYDLRRSFSLSRHSKSSWAMLWSPKPRSSKPSIFLSMSLSAAFWLAAASLAWFRRMDHASLNIALTTFVSDAVGCKVLRILSTAPSTSARRTDFRCWLQPCVLHQ